MSAQQARRVLDRLVGFELSPVLWRKIKQGLSAGRVQSVAVRLIVERERDIQNFESFSAYRVTTHFFNKEQKVFKAELPVRFKTKEEAITFLNDCISSDFSIASLDKKPAKKSPAAPFTTSTLQQEASRKLGFTVGQTMSVAQKLYEAGKITYMRTDSTNLSEDAMKAAKEQITTAYGEEFSNPRKYTKNQRCSRSTRNIRPTYAKCNA